MTDLVFRSAAELAELVANRQVSPVELVDGAIARIEASQGTVNAFITVCTEEARVAAWEAEAAVMLGDPLPPLHGVPFAVKDLVNTAGVRTTFGSVAFADNVPAADSPSVARLKAAGAILAFKRTIGLVPHDLTPDGFCNQSHISPMTRTVMDTALMLQAMAGSDLRDP